MSAYADFIQTKLMRHTDCPNAAQHRRATEPARAQAKPKEGPVICDA